MESDYVVELRGVSFGFPPNMLAQPVVCDIDLRIETNDFLGIVGPNGGGKTTLLKIILGLFAPQRGTVKVFGQPPHRVRTRIGYVPQHAEIDPSVPADVLDVVLMGRLSRSLWGPRYSGEHVDRAMDVLQRVEMTELCRRPIRALSGGQRQRVLIARALAADAELLLLDEPTAGVDAKMERGLMELLHELNRTLPIVMISHDVSFVSKHLKRVGCLNRTMTLHRADEVSEATVAAMYHSHVRAVQHEDTCAHADVAAPPQGRSDLP